MLSSDEVQVSTILVSEWNSVLLEDVKSPPWKRNTGWHLDGAAVSRSLTDRLQLGNPIKQPHSRADSYLDTRHSINLNHNQPHSHFASASAPVQIHSPVFPLQTSGVEPSNTIPNFSFSTTKEKHRHLSK
ncbi:hypothetical protein NQZ68_022770 [Dissostichus eleginoides]|nr:hypothetical protein NQZ68_022770 [Dissostichus eleginoides]